MNEVDQLQLPPTDDPRWRRLLLADQPPAFRHLVSQLMFSRVRLMLQADPSEASIAAAAVTTREFFQRQQHRVQEDVQMLLQALESHANMETAR
ncbi:MAG TPA: hypothetical protein PLZ57_13435 [Pseudobdellovibrionaceae bacterium]|nr:hypothetical protein [Pseudobdellovibrionaceae bacterium]